MGFGKGDLAVVTVGDFEGYVNAKGEMVIQPQFKFAYSFGNEDYALVKVGDYYGVINKKGEFTVQPMYDDMWFPRNGRASFEQNGKWGYLDPANGEIIVPATYDYVAYYYYDDGYTVVENGGYYGVLDMDGKMVVPTVYDYVSE